MLVAYRSDFWPVSLPGFSSFPQPVLDAPSAVAPRLFFASKPELAQGCRQLIATTFFQRHLSQPT